MLRLLLAVVVLAASAAGQPTSSQEQQREFDKYNILVAAQSEFSTLNGFSSPPICQACASLPRRLSPRTLPSFVSATTLAAPKKAQNELKRAVKALRKGPQDLRAASAALQKAVALHPDFAVAWSLLGKIQLAYGFREEGQASFERAVQADGAYLEPHADLAQLWLQDQDWTRLEEQARRMVRANPYFTLGHLYLGVVQFNRGTLDTAEMHALDAMATDDVALYPQTHYLLGQIYEKRGDVQLAIVHFRQFLYNNPPEPWFTNVSRHIRELEAR